MVRYFAVGFVAAFATAIAALVAVWRWMDHIEDWKATR